MKHLHRTLKQKLIKQVVKRQHTIHVLEVSKHGVEIDEVHRP